MSFERRQVEGAAVQSTLAVDINAGSTTFPIGLTSGWPDGSTGKFLIAIDRGTASEEKMFIQTRSGSNLTLESVGDRGAEGTTAQGHSTGATVEHVIGSTDIDEANYVVSQTVGKVTTKGDLLFGTSANTLARFPAGSNNTLPIYDNSTTTGMRTGLIDGQNIASSFLGNGLSGGNGAPGSVNVDNTGLEIFSDVLRLKDLGVTNAKIAAATILEDRLGFVVAHGSMAAPITTSSGSGATGATVVKDGPIGDYAFTAVVGRRYVVKYATVPNSDAINTTFIVYILDGLTSSPSSASTELIRFNGTISVAGGPGQNYILFEYPLSGLSAGVHTIAAFYNKTTGGNVSMVSRRALWVEDIGT